MAKQHDGYNMNIEFIKHVMILSIQTQPSVNICVSFQISPQKLQSQGVVFIFCDKGNADHFYEMVVFIQGNQITSLEGRGF